MAVSAGVILPHLLSLTAGFVDTAGFLVLQGLFTAHVTGNFVTLGASPVLGTSGRIAKLLGLSVFCSRLRGRCPALYPVRGVAFRCSANHLGASPFWSGRSRSASCERLRAAFRLPSIWAGG